MSYLSNELAAVSKKNGVRQVDVMRKTGIGIAPLSRIFSGRQDYVSTDMLDKIMSVVARTPQERGRIIRARLRDSYNGKDSGLVQINIKGGASPTQRFTPNDVSINPDVNAAFAYLYRLVPSKPQVGELMILQAAAMGMRE